MPVEVRMAPGDDGEGEDAQGPPEDPTGDDGLIRWMLGLDATRRLEAAQGFVDSVETLRHARRD